MKRFLKVLRRTLLGIGILVVLTLTLTVLVNWSDRPPSQAALKMHALIADRTPVSDADNGFVYAMGFLTGADADPQDVGARSLAWLEAFDYGDVLAGDPTSDFGNFENSSFGDRRELREICQKANDGNCRAGFDRIVAEGGLTEADRDFLSRYHELLKRPAWRESGLTDIRLPIPAYSHILHAQRLEMLDLRLGARAGAAAEIRARLEADHAFWRMVLAHSDQLISKMIAAVGLRQNFYFGNLVIRTLPAEQQLEALPEGWTREFSAREVSVARPMAGELWLFEPLTRNLLDPAKSPPDTDEPRETTWFHHLMGAFYQPQDLVNHMAEDYLAIADASEVPWSKMQDATEALRERERECKKLRWTLYNPIGQWLSTSSGDYSKYPLRAASVEGMRRAALLTVQMRARAVAPDRIEAELQSEELRNPFDGQPFAWNAEAQAVVFASPDGAPVNPHFYFY